MKSKRHHELEAQDSFRRPANEFTKRHSENHTEKVRQNLLSPRQPTRIATWNVRTMFAAGKASVIADELKRYKISLGLSETRWL